jgi:hypothetical protein
LFLLAALLTAPVYAATPLDSVVVLDGFVSAQAQVRLLNASPDVGPVDLYVAQYREAEDVVFEEISEAVSVPAASFLVRVYPAGETEDPLIETSVAFGQGAEHTLVLSGTTDDLELMDMISGTPGPSPSNAYVRFVHASPDASEMDLAVFGGNALHTDIGFREASDYSTMVGGTYDFEIRPAGESTAAVSIPGLWLQGARFYTIYLTGLAADEGPDDVHDYFVPAASRSPGSEGSFWVTDLDLLNTGSTAAAYTLVWLPRNTDNSNPVTSEKLTLGAGQVVRHEDVLASVFGFGDETAVVGALAVVSESPNLELFSRTFNLTDNGTFGQGMPGIAAENLIRAGTVTRIMFFTENGDARSNLGILNGTSSSLTVTWRQYLPDGTLWRSRFTELGAWENTQINHVFEGAEPLKGGYVELWTETHLGAFTAYGSVLDDATSDPITVMPQ